MATKIIMPKLGFDMAAGKVVRWLKNIGEPIRKGEPILEIETDKATVEVVADADGLLNQIFAQPGAEVPVGETIGEINGASNMPIASSTKPAPVPQTVTQTPTDTSTKATSPTPQTRIEASPLAKRIAAELGIDLYAVKGSGPNGRIIKEDIEAHIATHPIAQPTQPVLTTTPTRAATPALTPPSMPRPAPVVQPFAAPIAIAPTDITYGDKPLTKIRQVIARRMAESKGPVPQFYLTVEVDIAAGIALCNQLMEAGKTEELRVSPMHLTMKACAIGLRKFPNLNASFGGDKITLHERINIGVAVAVEGGLMTPVVPDCDQKSVAQLAREVLAAAQRARTGKLAPSDLTPGTFSVSNLGMFDIENFVAIINPPEAAILAIGTAKEIPIVEQGQIKIGTRMKLTLSADHRVTDGAEAARFLQEVKRLLQTPMSLFL